MISIIISSYQPKYYFALEKNIAETVGVPYEIIKIENPGSFSISEAYNTGASKAQGGNLLFLHEDILFHTRDWGKNLIKHLSNPEVGVVGIAGSNYVPHAPSGWFIKNDKYQFYNFIQNSKEQDAARLLTNLIRTENPAFAVDGVFLAITKSKFKEFGFSTSLKGFHAYDLDFSLRVAGRYRNIVVGNILLEHFSMGHPAEDWLDATISVRRKIRSKFNRTIDIQVEKERFENFVYSVFRFKGIRMKNVFFSLQFYPFKILPAGEFASIVKMYIKYFRFKNYYEQRF